MTERIAIAVKSAARRGHDREGARADVRPPIDAEFATRGLSGRIDQHRARAARMAVADTM